MGGPPLGGLLGPLPIPSGLGGSLASGGSVIPTDALVEWWKINEGTGTNVVNYVDAANYATISGSSAPTWSDSDLEFVYTADSFLLSAIAGSCDFSGTVPMSVSTWININVIPGGTAAIFSHENPAAILEGWSLLTISGAPAMVYQDSSGSNSVLIGNNTLSDSVLYNVVATFTGVGNSGGQGMSLYVNGVMQTGTGSGFGFTAPVSNGTVSCIGNRSNGSLPFSGSIGDVRIYNIALDQTQVTYLYNQGQLGPQ